MSEPPLPPSQMPNYFEAPVRARDDLRVIAFHQKAVLLCAFIQLAAMIASRVVGGILEGTRAANGREFSADDLIIDVLLFAFSFLVLAISTAFALRLSLKLWSVGAGIAIGLCAMIPCVSLFILGFISHKATSVLQENGVPVGLMGAKKKISEI